MVMLARSFAGSCVLFAVLFIASCTPAAEPTIVSAPTKQDVAPVAATPVVAKPAATTVPKPVATAAPKPASEPDWKGEWEKTLAAAKKEGKVIVVGSTGDLYRQAAMAFQNSYPEIRVEFTGMAGSNFVPRILAERQAGQYLVDVTTGGSQSMFTLKDNKVFDPLRPVLILPEVLDDSKWFRGFDFGWMDKEGQFIFGFESKLAMTVYVNREFVPESELKSHDQLLDPKWKDKIVTSDPRRAGASQGLSQWLLRVMGEDWYRKFLAQVALMQDERAQMEAVIRGRYPITVGVNPATFNLYALQGLTANIKPLDPESEAGAVHGTGASHVALINRAPNPNAAKVYVNWLLSREGQQVYVDAVDVPSARLDTTGHDYSFFGKPKPNVNYVQLNHENTSPYRERLIEIAQEVFK